MSNPSITAQQSRAIVAQLKRSRIYRDYEQAFRDTTGLPIALRPIEGFDLPHHGDPKESPFCALMAQTNKSCAACLQLQRRVEEEACLQPKTLHCFAGLCDSAVPVRVGENLVAFLQTGQVFTDKPKGKDFSEAARQLLQFGVASDLKRLEEAYFQTRVVSKKQYESIVRLLTIFAQHLSALSNQLMVEADTAGMPSIEKARALINARHADQLSLGEVAQAVNMSAFYVCKSFKKVTGLTFTSYLARVRIEKVKNLLLDPNRRVSEAAYEAGFQSLSQFNRVFRRIAGESPSAYRERLHGRG
jgi:AraC-like DNA-binding protein/ligand-binding sensor protein